MRRASLVLLLAALASCGTRGRAETAEAEVIDTLQAEFLDEGNGCGFLRSAQAAGPQALVTDYVRRDAAGGFLQGSPWMDSALTCPAGVPGWDASTVISAHEVGTATVAGAHATVPVSYTVLGALWGTDSFVVTPRSTQVVFELVRTPWGWRIDGPRLGPMVLVDSLLGRVALPDSVVGVIRGAAAE
ncbi:MAG: hypothetical protein IPK12_22550 [Gemmatimonadetes bacterium]|nr:hypothetical protein [Gemmatimonadota bacterium]